MIIIIIIIIIIVIIIILDDTYIGLTTRNYSIYININCTQRPGPENTGTIWNGKREGRREGETGRDEKTE